MAFLHTSWDAKGNLCSQLKCECHCWMTVSVPAHAAVSWSVVSGSCSELQVLIVCSLTVKAWLPLYSRSVSQCTASAFRNVVLLDQRLSCTCTVIRVHVYCVMCCSCLYICMDSTLFVFLCECICVLLIDSMTAYACPA